MIKTQIEIPRKEIEEFCQRWKVTEFAFFGSVLREDFRRDSDIDVLVTLTPNSGISLLDLVRMENELQEIFKRDVDLITKGAIEQSHNWIRRKEILGTAKVFYVVK